MDLNFISPIGINDHQLGRLVLELLDVIVKQLLRLLMEVWVHQISLAG